MELTNVIDGAKEVLITESLLTPTKKMGLMDVIERAKEASQDVLNLGLPSVTGATKTDDGWRVTMELIERKAIPDTQDLLGVYEMLFNDEGHLMSYERIRIRRRMDAEERVE